MGCFGSNGLGGYARFFVAAALPLCLWSFPLAAQGPPVWPTPVVTPTPLPEPAEPVPEATPAPVETPSPTATPVSEEAAPEPSPTMEGDEEGTEVEGDEGAAEDPADAPQESEEETNPGEVAFTDYAPFDLEEIERQSFDSKWKNFIAGARGMSRYSLFDGKVKFRIGGKAQLDGTVGSGNDEYDESYSPVESDFGIRRFEVFAAGRIKKFNFNFAFEFGPDWGISNAWIEGAEGGLEVWGKYLGKLRVGMMNEPFSLERQTSSYNGGFLERSLPVQTIAPGSNVGAMVHDSGSRGRFSWAAGMFSFGQKNDSNASVSALSLTGRFTFLPVYRNKGRDLIHVGLSVSSRSPTGGDTRYRSRPEARFIDYLVDTGTIETGHLTLWGAEFATVRGPLWVAAEIIQSKVSAAQLDNPTFSGSYVQVGWFLSGDHRPYRTNSGTFDRMRPRNKYGKGSPFKKKNGGTWELVGRLSRVDLTDEQVEGGELTDLSAALNWYPNATTRIQLNYIHASPKDRGSANIILLRLQYQPW